MKTRALAALAIWEILILGYLWFVMVSRGIPFDVEKQRMLLEAACVGVVVVLLAWPVCRVLSAPVAIGVGLILGLATPLLVAWAVGHMANHWQTSWGHFMTPIELWSLALGISIPSAVAAAIIGVLAHKRPSNATP